MRSQRFAVSLLAASLLFSSAAIASADTIRLRDGSIIRGDIIAFGDQQFSVLVGANTRGRRSRVTIYMEDVDTIEFDRAANVAGANTPNTTEPININPSSSNTTAPNPTTPARGVINPVNPPVTTSSTNAPATVAFREATLRVRGDATTNGWTNSGITVRSGQRLRVTSSGRIALGQGRFATPAGITTLADEGKLMSNEATGGLIAVIGDDNDEFIFIGARREFTAPRDGVLFLGVNEGNLTDNTGNYDVVVGYEP
ncbi:MAG: hypothetical protein MSG64_06645 [Pyrinomonadaceae bacterium MAG19_C2-C3]|nr:hypothetical protein [Pyrinomonadaceae bacterium MAG19_C2-C3]